MPFTSTQISGLVGGQQVMFSNQAAFANQIGGLRDGPQQMMANPYPSPSYGVAGLDPGSPDIGTKLAGGTALAVPGALAGASMAASLMGYKSPLGLLDPFTGVTRAFGAGSGGSMAARAGVMAGSEGMGLGYAWGNVSGAFAKGGMRAGLGAIGGGLAGAAVAGGVYYAAGKTIDYFAGRAYEGVQNVQDVRRMAGQYLDPQFGKPGARPGGQMNMGMAGQITDVLRDVVNDDVKQDMASMRKVMDKAGQLGMLQGVGDAAQFKERFKKVVSAAKSVATMLGSTLEDALPFVQQMNSMGVWKAADVLGVAAEARGLGRAGGQAMMGAMQTGAQMSHAMGGSLAAGAQTGRQLYGQVSAAMRLGTFSEEQLRESTGGIGGAEGRQIMAGQIQRVVAGMGETALGRLTMAGLAKVDENGRVVGLDQAQMERMNRGEISISQLQARGQKLMGNKETATSFFNRAPQLAQQMGAQGGLELFQAGLKQAMRKAFGDRADELGGSEIENRMIQLLSGADQRRADEMQTMLKDLPRIRAERERNARAAMEDSFREAEIRKNRSFAGLKEAVGKALDRSTEGLEKVGQSLAVGMSETTDRLSDWISGRAPQLARVSDEEIMRTRMAGGLGKAPSLQQLGISHAGQSFVDGGVFTNMTLDAQRSGFGRRVFGGMAAGAGVGAIVGGGIPGAIGGAIVGGAAGLMGFDPARAMMGDMQLGGGVSISGMDASNLKPRAFSFLEAGLNVQKGEAGEGEVDLGGGLKAKSTDLQLTAQRAVMRSRGASLDTLLGGETPEKRQAMDVYNSKLRKVLSDPATANELRELKDDKPEEYARALMKKVRESDPEAAGAIETLTKGHPMGAGSEGAMLDVTAIAMKETKAEGGEFAIDFNRPAENLGGIAIGTSEELAKKEEDLFQQMASDTGAGGSVWSAMGVGAATGAAAGAGVGVWAAGLGAIPGAAIGAIGGAGLGLVTHLAGRDMSAQDFRDALTSKDYSREDVLEYVKAGGKGVDNAFTRSALQGGAAGKLMKQIQESSPDQLKTLEGQIGQSAQIRLGQMGAQESERMAGIASRQGPIGNISGVSSSAAMQMEEVRKSIASSTKAGDAEAAMSRLTGINVSEPGLQALRRGEGGDIGRQLALQKDIAGIGEMDEKQLKRFRRGKLDTAFGGQDMVAAIRAGMKPEEASKLDELLKGGIKGSAEISQFKEILSKAAPQTFGTGTGKSDPMLDAYTKFTDAAGKFSEAVGRLVGDGKGMPDVANPQPAAGGQKL